MYTYTAVQLQAKTFGELKSIARELNVVPSGDRRCRQSWIDAIVGVELPFLALIENSPSVETESVQDAIALAAKTSPGVDCVQKPKSIAHELLELFKAKAHVIPDSCVAKIEPKLSQSEIAQTAENSLDAEADRNSIFTGIALSDSFLARYSPPQFENIRYQADADGQLSLLDFEVQSEPEPPDPDDFESLDAFREVIALWDLEYPEPLEVSLDSFCEWAPCPDDWYEPVALLELSEVLELSPTVECSITCKFLIPVFDVWCDRPNRQNDSDEPPDTWIFARLPKPKPPSFPPVSVAAGDRTNCIKKFARTATLSSGRVPPGGDAVF